MRRWKIVQQNESLVSFLCETLSCSHFFARILINRGADTPEKARDFLNTSSSCLLDPYLFQNMSAVVQRIGVAIRNCEKITVYGDYDVDGITATSLLLEVLRELGGYVEFYIPSRFTEGYGVNSAAIQKIAANGTKLLITVDTGITAVAEVEEAKTLGMDVIVTDHHECQNILPNTLILNPKCPESGYPFKELAGVGVVYKLACALDREFGTGDGAERYTLFTAIGTIADIMPMRDENRYIVRHGLENLKNTQCLGLSRLLDRCVGERPLDTSTVGFIIAPRINAAGRMGSAQVGVELLTTHAEKRADELVEELCRENNHRQTTENTILEQAIEMIETDPENRKRSAIVLWHPEWHNGVIGIVASRLKERYGKPCILFTVNGEYAKGSGRSVRPFNLFESLERLSNHLEKFGGHAFAAGVLVRTDKLPEFRDALCEEVRLFQLHNQFDESIEVDCILHDSDLTVEKIRELDKLSPFGRGNETPIFCFKNAEIVEAIATANKNHMRLTLRCGKVRLTAFYFNMSPDRFNYCAGDVIDLVFEADINTYNGRQSVRLLVKDLRFAESCSNELFTEWERIKAEIIVVSDIPTRSDMAAVYRYIQKQFQNEHKSFDIFSLPTRIDQEQGYEITLGSVYFSLEVLLELGILAYDRDERIITDLAIFANKRVNLEDSYVLKIIKEKAGEIE